MRKDAFIEKWHGMAVKVARTMCRSYKLDWADGEDIVQETLFRLSKLTAEQRRMPDVWIRTCINNSSRNTLSRILRSSNRVVSYDTAIEGGENLTYADTIPDPTDVEQQATTRVMVDRLLAACNEQQKQVVEMSLGFHGEPVHDHVIANRLRIPVKKVREILDTAFQRMRDTASPSQFEALSTTCNECGETETLLIPVMSQTPTNCFCMQCNESTPCTIELLPISLGRPLDLVETMEVFETTGRM